MNSLTITVPGTPPREVMPNARVHWSSRARAARSFREAAYLAGRAIWTEGPDWDLPVLSGPVTARATIFWEKGRKRCDPDAALSGLKALYDGLEYAELFANDKQLIHLPVRQGRDPGGLGYVAVELAEGGGDE
jgi:hypothetical protein